MKTNSDSPVFCGTDFSANAAQAATVAAGLAAQAGRSLVLIHVADEFNGCLGNPAALEKLVQTAEERLQQEAERLKESGAAIETKVLTGQVAERAITEFARERPASLLVVSSVSKTAFDRWTVGSVSERLAQSHSAPTLVIRSGVPFESWKRAERPLRIFVAVNFSAPSAAALQWIRAFRKLGPCEIVAAHVNYPPDDARRLGLATSMLENSPELQQVLEREMKTLLDRYLDGVDIRILVTPAIGRPDARLIELAIEAHADLLVTGTSQQRGFGQLWHPTSRGILHHAPMSVVCVPFTAAVPHEEPLPTIRRVLVATDFSALGNQAVRHASALLGEGGTLFLLHVLHPTAPPSGMSQAGGHRREDAVEVNARRKEVAAEQLRALIPHLPEQRSVAAVLADSPEPADGPAIRSEVHVVAGEDAAKAINQAAERFGVDVICLGSHGATGLSAVFMGSVAQQVVAQSQRPILIVRPQNH